MVEPKAPGSARGKKITLAEKNDDGSDGIHMPEWNTAYLKRYLGFWNLDILRSYLDRYITAALDKNRAHGTAVMHRIHQSILLLFYSYLHEHNLDASRIFDSEASQTIDTNCERSKQDMLEFFPFMVRRTHELSEDGDELSIARIAEDYINAHFAEDISRDDIAAYACVTPNYLSTLFHAETGKTIREYISDCRLNESKRLLAATRKSISAIAMECGFGNISYFSTVFRKCVGKSPVEWRKEQKRT